jgi:hypothetical protein
MNPLAWMTDPNLCGATFGGPTWEAGRALVAAIFGLSMSPEALAIYRECTARAVAPTVAFARAMVAAGRGSGKTLLASFIAVFVAASRDWHGVMGPGELVTAAIVCPDRRQARVAIRFIKGLLRASPMLSALIISETADSVTLSTGCIIEVHTASYKNTRGYSFCVFIIDEACFLPTDSAAHPDQELVRAILPGLGRVPGSLLLCISSPYAKRGVLWDAFRRHHGVDDAPVLTWQAPTRRMNPTIDQGIIDQALADDAAAAASEWLATWRDDVSGYIDRDDLNVIPGRGELPPLQNGRHVATSDPASGSGRDSFALAIGHADTGGCAIVDRLVEIVPPFSPDAAVRELAAVLRAYGINRVTSDRWGGEWVVEAWRKQGIRCETAQMTRSEYYLEALPIFSARRCELPDGAVSPIAAKMLQQFCQLERKTGKNRDSVDHPYRGGGATGCHDDLSNVTAMLLVQLNKPARRVGGPATRTLGVSGGAIPVPSQTQPDRRILLPPIPPKPWTHGGTTPCPLPQHMRRSR